MGRHGLISALFVLSIWNYCPGQSDLEKLPVPKSAEQGKAEHFVKLHYATQYAQHDPGSMVALSHQLRDDIDQYSDDGPTRYVMLREARELALDGGDLDEAYAAIDDMGRLFAVDVPELKTSAMTAFIDKSGLPPPVLIDTYLKFTDRSLDTGDIDLANKACQLASMLADQQHDPATNQRVREEHTLVMDAVRERKSVLAAMNKVRLHPDDGEANLLVGKYACFVRELWKVGLPYLASSSDAKLKALAQQELDAGDADATLGAADGWWDYAANAVGKPAERAKLHAADLYRQLIPSLSGDKKDRAQQRALRVKE